MWTAFGQVIPSASMRFGASKAQDKTKQERKPQCASMPPSRPESPVPSSEKESLQALLRKKDHWAGEVYKHRNSAEDHTLNYLMRNDKDEEALEQRHLKYVDKCENWHDQVIGVIKKKLNMPSVSSPLNPAHTTSRQY